MTATDINSFDDFGYLNNIDDPFDQKDIIIRPQGITDLLTCRANCFDAMRDIRQNSYGE